MTRRKGFSLVEAVVAMSLSLLVLAASTSVIFTTINVSSKLTLSQSATQQADNILSCYQSDNVVSGLKLLYGEGSFEDGNNILYFDNANKLTASSENAVWRMECQKDGTLISLRAIEISSEEEIYAIQYTKAS